MFRLLRHLLFYDVEKAKWFQMDFEEQLEVLATLVSRHSFPLTARMELELDYQFRYHETTMIVTFEYNGVPIFDDGQVNSNACSPQCSIGPNLKAQEHGFLIKIIPHHPSATHGLCAASNKKE
jgi:hypothetical protein